jgi:hypothetical protein
MAEVRTRPLFVLTLTTNAILPEGSPAHGDRLIGIVAEGTFDGDRLRGAVLPGGNDWLGARGAGEWTINCRIPLKTDDGAIIAMTYRGVRTAPAEVLARARRGEPVDRSEYQVRMSSMFETSASKYYWLNQVVGLGLGQPQPGGIRYEVFELL